MQSKVHCSCHGERSKVTAYVTGTFCEFTRQVRHHCEPISQSVTSWVTLTLEMDWSSTNFGSIYHSTAGASGSIKGQAGAGLHGNTGTEALGINYGQAGAGLHIPIHDRSKGLQPKVKPELFHTHNQSRSKGLHPRLSWNNSTFLPRPEQWAPPTAKLEQGSTRITQAEAKGFNHGQAGKGFQNLFQGRSIGLHSRSIPKVEKVSTIPIKVGATGSTSNNQS